MAYGERYQTVNSGAQQTRSLMIRKAQGQRARPGGGKGSANEELTEASKVTVAPVKWHQRRKDKLPGLAVFRTLVGRASARVWQFCTFYILLFRFFFWYRAATGDVQSACTLNLIRNGPAERGMHKGTVLGAGRFAIVSKCAMETTGRRLSPLLLFFISPLSDLPRTSNNFNCAWLLHDFSWYMRAADRKNERYPSWVLLPYHDLLRRSNSEPQRRNGAASSP